MKEMLIFLLFCSWCLFSIKRLKLLTLFFQQEEYDNVRFFKTIIHKLLIDKKLSIIILIITLLSLHLNNITLWLSLFIATLLSFYFIEFRACKTIKKPLVMTKRVIRILVIAFSILLTLTTTLFYKLYYSYIVIDFFLISIYFIIIIQSFPLFLILANLICHPIENRIQNSILNKAKLKLSEINPTIIGITGSYGKTTVKHILAHILSSVTPTLATPRGINTLMGISRTILNDLQQTHKFFIVEMGAYKPGSIDRLCKLTPPNHGILTAIDNVHYERFKDISQIAKAKTELIKAVFNKKGLMVINKDFIDIKFINHLVNNNKVLISSSRKTPFTKNQSYNIFDIHHSTKGLNFKISHNDKIFKIGSSLYGKHQCSNIALAFILAKNLGIPINTIIASIKTIPQIKHRLEVIRNNKSGITIIDDSYNSNPKGFKSALKILSLLSKENNGRKILVTPGMVELGELHEKEHFDIGKFAGSIADYILVILPERIPSFIKGIKEASKKKLLTFDNFKSAKSWLDSNIQHKDVILYENDLPDIYETKIKL